MSTPKTLEDKVLEELQKTGYPTEIVSASIMQKCGWNVIHNPSYLDDSEGRSREFDIRAYRRLAINTVGDPFIVGVYLITECKKSDKPWVFFVTPEKHDLSRLGPLIKGHVGDKRIFTDRSSADSFVSDDALRSFHHYFQSDRLARTFHEPLKGQEKADHSQMIYTAVMSSIKATLFHYEDAHIKNWLRIYYPVIIFGGVLFEAQVDSSKSVTLTKADHVQLSFHYMAQKEKPHQTIWDNHHQFIIDVVHEDYIEQFLQIIEEEQEALAKALQTRLEH